MRSCLACWFSVFSLIILKDISVVRRCFSIDQVRSVSPGIIELAAFNQSIIITVSGKQPNRRQRGVVG